MLLALLNLLLAGCANLKDPETSQEYSGDVVAQITPDQAAGQSFLARRGDLSAIQLWLRASGGVPGPAASLTIELYHSPEQDDPLAAVTIPFDQLNEFPVTINFPVQADPPGQTYYLILKCADGEMDVYGRAEDVYPDGALTVDGQAQAADAAFRGIYRYRWAELTEDLRRLASGIWLIIPLLLVTWVPGRLILWVLERAYARPARLFAGWDWGQRAALAVGISLALAPLAALWTTTIGLSLSRAAIWGIYALAGAALAGLFATRRWRAGWKLSTMRIDPVDLALAGILVFTLAQRLVMARDLAGPPWVDPVHHSLITRLIIEQGGLPTEFQSAAEAESARYHPGFHVTVAAFSQLAGLPIPDAMLLFGQVQNALSVLAVYLLAVRLTRDRIAGLFAALMSGAFFPMPAYYLSWGRYTQLAGLLILPAAVALIETLATYPWRRSGALLWTAAAVCAGLFLTHYRVTAFMALWLAARVLAETLRRLDRRAIWSTLAEIGGRYLAVGLVAILLTLPWWPQLWQQMLAPRLANRGEIVALDISWGYLTPVYGRAVMWLALLGLLVSILRLGWFGPTLALWVGLMFMSANQGSISLPLAGSVDKLSVEITLFAPLCVLAGYAISSLLAPVRRYAPVWAWRAAAAVAAVVAAGLALAAAPKMLNLLNPTTILLRQADRPALEWVQANLPPEARIAINPFLWGYGAYAGQDGGYWISPITGRQTLPPIVTYNLGERDLIDSVNATSQAMLNYGKDPQQLYQVLQVHSIDYVYLGRRGGAISPQALSESELFRLRYHQDGVWIFELAGDINHRDSAFQFDQAEYTGR